MEFAPTIVLAGSKVAGYSACAALEHVRRTFPEIPVIVLANSLGEAAAVELVKAGAKDIVSKQDVPRDGAARLATRLSRRWRGRRGAGGARKPRKRCARARTLRDIAEVGGD